ncbi:MAG: HK97 family phage prohead protease [Alphaproteobacteria bacterium]|nr:HK97 family phage prohead protease [Alphaproteobacteria bacterium]MBU1552329.1 HK97 family phage prohead protease [Alphaproteobacteria bacterium]MBU2334522.1 HK97 family phage prohead protease [Alphaproteobacteria bacterium]MBU2386377.1 HK97 family phage prohead protease [Alphaproteobacteria bacterium]
MTSRANPSSFHLGSIESVTGWSGAHSDDPPSAVPATIPGAKHKTGIQPECFDVSEGAPMNLYKNTSRLFRATAVLDGFKAEGDGIVVGYASTFGGEPDSHGDIIAPGAFASSLAQHKSSGTLPAMLWAHKGDQPIGKWTSMREDGHGLLAEGSLNLRTSAGRDAWEHLKAGDADGLSIGYRLPSGSEEYQRDGSTLLKEIHLVEVSVVVIPSNRSARVSALKSINSKSDLVDLLREAGLARSAAQRVAAGGYPALAGGDHQKAIDLAADIDAAIAAIRSL